MLPSPLSPSARRPPTSFICCYMFRLPFLFPSSISLLALGDGAVARQQQFSEAHILSGEEVNGFHLYP